MKELISVCLCEIFSVYMCMTLKHTQVSTMPVLSVSGLWSGLCSLMEYFGERKKYNSWRDCEFKP